MWNTQTKMSTSKISIRELLVMRADSSERRISCRFVHMREANSGKESASYRVDIHLNDGIKMSFPCQLNKIEWDNILSVLLNLEANLIYTGVLHLMLPVQTSNLATNNVSPRRHAASFDLSTEERMKGTRREEQSRNPSRGEESEEWSALLQTDTQCGFDRAGEALDVKWRRQFPLPLAPTGE